MFLFAVSAVQSMFFVEGRHRVVIVPILLVALAYGIVDLLRRFSRTPFPAVQHAPLVL